MLNFKKEFIKYFKHFGVTNINNECVCSLTPYITETRNQNLSHIDVFTRLLMDRIIFLGSVIDNKISNIVQAQLLFLQSVDNKKDIQIYINSPGGNVYAGLAIYDTMQIINPDVVTICTGIASSMAAVLLCAGKKGKRFSLLHSKIMIHQPLGGVEGCVSDIEITTNEIIKLKKEILNILSLHTGQKISKIEKDFDRDFWMSSNESCKYGIIDNIIKPNINKINFKK